MKSKEQVLSMMMAILAEIQSGNDSVCLKARLEILNRVLDEEDIPEEYWEQIEEAI